MTVTAEEFLRRFLLHTPPRGFVRIRFCGFLANRRRREHLPLEPFDNAHNLRAQDFLRLALPALRRHDGPDREAYPSTDPTEIC